MDFTFVVRSLSIPRVPLWVLLPDARAVPPAAESVTPFVPDCVFTRAELGKLGKHKGTIPIFPCNAPR